MDQETKAALLGGPSRWRPFYQLILPQESGEWQTTSELAHQLHLSESDIAEKYWEAVRWAQQVTAR